MEGFEKDWNFTDASRRYVTYTNLDPGEYTFRVRASNNDAVWNMTGTSLKIIILPPWWKTLWFRIIALSLVIFFVFAIFRSRVRQLNKQKILLEKTVAINTAELKELNASKDKFFSIIAHDLKNPFNTLIGFSEMMKESVRLNDPTTFYEYAAMINTSAVQTYRLLENLLEWASAQRGKLEFIPVQLNLYELVKDEFSMAEEMAIGKDIELICHIDEYMTITADKNMLRTILRNLISNAIKFTHRKGKVEVNAKISGQNAEISVSDNGIGMSSETISKLFKLDSNLLTRGTDNESGTGLGLFLCKEFVEKHGGRIWAESAEADGSVFKFIIPLNLSNVGIKN
jgi:signal transduction histidine kinase